MRTLILAAVGAFAGLLFVLYANQPRIMLPSRVADVPITRPHDGTITLGTDTSGDYLNADGVGSTGTTSTIDSDRYGATSDRVCTFEGSSIPEACIGLSDGYVIHKDGTMEKVR